MRLVLDVGVSERAIAKLTGAGHDAVHLSSLGLAELSDDEIVDWAKQEGRAVVTFDQDFLKIAARTNMFLPSIIHIRLPRATVQQMIHLVASAATQYETELKHGAIVTIRPHRTHCRNLPIHED